MAFGYVLTPLFPAQQAMMLLQGHPRDNHLYIECLEVAVADICSEATRVALPYDHSFTCPDNAGWYYPTGYGSDCYHDTYLDRFPYSGARKDCFYNGDTATNTITVRLPGSLWDPGYGPITATVEVWSAEFGLKIGQSDLTTITPSGVIASPVFTINLATTLPAGRTFSLRFVLNGGGGNASMPQVIVEAS
jgi:hypothetical protein